MPPHRELNPRFQAHIARARRVRVVSVGLLVTCLLVGTGSALAMLAPQGNGAQAAIKNSLASVADTFDSVGSAFSHVAGAVAEWGTLLNVQATSAAGRQVAAVSSDDSISNRIYRFFCPWFSNCDEPEVEFTTNTTPTPVQPRPQPQQPITIATTSQNTSTQRAGNTGTGTTQPIQQTVVNNPVIERVIERVVQGAPASLAGYVTQADLLSQIAAVKSSVGTQLYGDWYNNPGSSSNNGGIVGVIGQMGRIDSLSGTELSDITVDGVSGLTDADIPDGITATNYLLLTGGAITGDLSLSGTLTAGALAVSGVSSGGAIEAPYFTATSTSASSTFPNLNATNSTTTNATSTNLFSTLGRFTTAITDAFSAVSATITNLTSTTLVATNATTTRLDAFDYVAVGRTATTTIRGDGVASTIPYASSTAISVSGVGFFGTASTTNLNLSGTATLQSIAADSLLYNNSSRQLAAATVGSSLSFTGSSLSLNLGNGNTWTGLQQFYGAASSTLFSANWAKFGATASSTFGTDGSLTMGGNVILNGKYLSGDGGDEGVYVDSSGSVGIGTASPGTKLDVQGNIRTSLQVQFGDTASYIQESGGLQVVSGTSRDLIFSAGAGGERVRIKNDTGNVGIGTTTPQWLLNPTSASAAQLALSAGAGVGQWAFRNAGGNLYFATTTVAGTATTTTSALTIIGSSGNVGIGTTSPSYPLHVVDGTTSLTFENYGNADYAELKLVTTNTARSAWVEFNNSDGNDWNVGKYLNDDFTIQRRWVSDLGSGVLGSDFVINSSGNVGIGTTSPGSLLSVGNTNGINFSTATSTFNSTGGINLAAGCFAKAGSCLAFSDIAGTLGIAQGGTATSTQVTNGVNYFDGTRITSGTALTFDGTTLTGPSLVASGVNALTVPNGASIVGAGAAGWNLGDANDTLAVSSASFYVNPATVFRSTLSNDSATYLQINGGTSGYTYFNGNVGIGTASPGAKLNVFGTSADIGDITTAIARIDGSATNGIFFGTQTTSPFGVWMQGASTGGFGTKYPLLLNPLGGNVGIGTTSPWGKLSVADSSDANNHFSAKSFAGGDWSVGAYYGSDARALLTNNAYGGFGSTYAASNGDGGLRLGQTGNYSYIVGGTHLLLNPVSGNVGIGTTTPQWLLNPTSASAAQLALSAGAGVGQWAFRNAGGNLYFATTTVAGTATTTTSALTIIGSSGNVGIGTTNPNDGKLEVKGGTVCVDTDSNDSATSCIANESDERLKENITSISASSSLDIINALNPVSFDWRASDPEVLSHYPLLGRYAGNTHSIGLIAQQVMPVLPEALSLETVGDDEVQYFQLDYTKFVPHLIGAVKELWAKVQDLGQKVAALLQSDEEQQTEIESLKSRVQSLESQLGAAAAPSNPPPQEPQENDSIDNEDTESPEAPSDEPAAEIEPPAENPGSEPVEEVEESEAESTPESTVEPEPVIESSPPVETPASE